MIGVLWLRFSPQCCRCEGGDGSTRVHKAAILLDDDENIIVIRRRKKCFRPHLWLCIITYGKIISRRYSSTCSSSACVSWISFSFIIALSFSLLKKRVASVMFGQFSFVSLLCLVDQKLSHIVAMKQCVSSRWRRQRSYIRELIKNPGHQDQQQQQWYYATCSKRRLTEETHARGQLAEPVCRRTDGRTTDPRKSLHRRQLAEPVGRHQMAEFDHYTSVCRLGLKFC